MLISPAASGTYLLYLTRFIATLYGQSRLLLPRFDHILGIFQINACDLTDQFYCRHLIAGEEALGLFQSIKEGKRLAAVRTRLCLTTHLRFACPAGTKLCHKSLLSALPAISITAVTGD